MWATSETPYRGVKSKHNVNKWCWNCRENSQHSHWNVAMIKYTIIFFAKVSPKKMILRGCQFPPQMALPSLISSHCTFNIILCTFNIISRTFNIISRAFNIISRAFNIIWHGKILSLTFKCNKKDTKVHANWARKHDSSGHNNTIFTGNHYLSPYFFFSFFFIP